MGRRQLFSRETDPGQKPPSVGASPDDGRTEAVQRLQVGVMGLFSVVLMAAIASALLSRAQVAEERAVPDAAPTTEPTAANSQTDPLADAGVAPAVPSDADKKDREDTAENTQEEAASEPPTIPDIDPR